MIPSILSIASSTIIFVIFKLFKRYNIDTFQAIIFNYFTAFILGISLFGHEFNEESLTERGWIISAVLCSFLFIGLFFFMAKSSQDNGVGSTSIAVKMSMAISLILMIIGYSESVTLLKALGIFLAFVGVFLVSYSKGKNTAKNASKWMLIVLFIGSGLLDFTLNYVQKYELKIMTPSLFTAIGMGFAGTLGSLILAYRILKGKSRLEIKNLIAGLILGIPNFFSIYLLLLSYQTTGWKDSTVLTITNVSVVLCSSIIGFIVFKESTDKKKIIGLISAILAITILYFAN